MKKSILFKAMLALLIMSVVVISSCNKDGDPNGKDFPVQPQSVNVIKEQVLPDNMLGYFDADQVNVTSTFDIPLQSSSPDMLGDPTATPTSNTMGLNFRELLMRLKLTREQTPIVQRYINAYQICVQEVLARTNAQRREILYAAELQRKAIIERATNALKGVTDRARIAEIRKAANEAIKKLNDATAARLNALIDKTALCDCWTKLIRAIRAQLTTEQIPMFERWLAAQISPCARTTNRQ